MKDKNIWLGEYADKAMRAIGIKNGQIVLDFGAGEGNYTIPVSHIIGKLGKVYAYEKDKTVINKFKKNIASLKLDNIEIIHSRGKFSLPFEKNFFDVVLLYDVIHHYYFTKNEMILILREIYEITKPNALISVFPKHMDEDEFRDMMEKVGFSFEKEIPLILLHYGFLEKGKILNFKKIKSNRGFRHQWGLPLRGQRTKSNFRRNKGKVMGVLLQVNISGEMTFRSVTN